MPSKTIEDFAYQVRDYMRSAEVVEGKNELNHTAISQTINGVTFTVNNDKSISLSGTASDGIEFNIYHYDSDTYNPSPYKVLSGCPESGSSSTYMLRFIRDGAFSKNDTGSGVLLETTLTGNIDIRIQIASGIDCTGLVFKPMICSQTEWNASHTYEPYYVPVKDSKLSIADQQVLGAWNELENNLVSTTVNGVTYTKKSDGTVDVTGQVTTGQSYAHAAFTSTKTYPAGTYYYSDGLTGDLTHKGTIIKIDDNSGTTLINTLQGITSFTLTEPHKLYVRFYRDFNETGNYTIKPMLAPEPNQPYVSYAMTNRELTDSVVKLENEPYTILATATGSASTTYADLFSIIKTAYNALSADKKARCEIWQNTNGASLIFKNFGGVGVFTSMVTSGGNALFYVVRFDTNEYRKLTLNTNGTMTNADFSSQAQSQNLYLVMR